MKFLIVEDDETNRTILVRFLSPYGQCDVAQVGADAVRLLREVGAGCEPYSLICLDLMLPDMSGHDVLKLLRKWEREDQSRIRSKVVVISGLSDPQNVLRAFQEGCEAYVSKPVVRDELLRELTKLAVLG